MLPGAKRAFLKLDFEYRLIDAINNGDILHNKAGQAKLLSHFEDKTIVLIPYTHSNPIAAKIYNYKKLWQGFNFNEFKSSNTFPC